MAARRFESLTDYLAWMRGEGSWWVRVRTVNYQDGCVTVTYDDAAPDDAS